MNDNNINNNVNLTPAGTQTPGTIPNPVPQAPVQPTPMPNTGLEAPQPAPMNNGVATPQQPIMGSTIPNQMPQEPVTPTPMTNPVQQPVMGAPVQPPQQQVANNIPNPNTVPPTPQQLNQMEIQPIQQQPVQQDAPKQKQKSNPVLIVLMFVALIGGAKYRNNSNR